MGEFWQSIEGELSPGGATFHGDAPSINPAAYASLVAFAQKYAQTLTQGTGIADGFQATRSSVVDSFVDWSKALEGYLTYPYTDAKGLVTTGMGNLIDPVGLALALPWKIGGSLADSGTVQAQWQTVKDAFPGVQSTACASLTTIRLDDADVRALISQKLLANEAELLKSFPGLADAPADAQLALHSMSWAMGAGFASMFPSFTAAFNAGDYATASAQSHMQGVGIDMRNLANQLLLLNAAAVAAGTGNPDTLYYVDGLTQLFDPSGAMLAAAAGGATSMIMSRASGIVGSVKAHPYRTAGIVALALGFIGGVTALVIRGRHS